MTRLEIYNAVKTVCTAYWVGQHQGECTSTYAVIKFKNQSTSINNAIAGWQVFEVMVYVPRASIATIDSIVSNIQVALINISAEPTGNITPDFLDTEKNAIMRSVEFRIPKQTIQTKQAEEVS